MEPDPELAETQLPQSRFASLNQRQPLLCNLGAIGQARRQASRGRAIPHGQTGALCQEADFRLMQLHIKEWGEYPVLGGSTLARPEVEGVVRVYAVGDRGDSSFGGE